MAAKTVEQIRIALRRQSLGGAEGRFAVQRTLEYLKESPIKLRNDVKEVTMNEIGDVEQNYGLRRFMFEKLPQLKYHNPKISFIYKDQEEILRGVTIKYADGKEENIRTDDKSLETILSEFLSRTRDTEMDKERTDSVDTQSSVNTP